MSEQVCIITVDLSRCRYLDELHERIRRAFDTSGIFTKIVFSKFFDIHPKAGTQNAAGALLPSCILAHGMV
jgi:hypothetical protein